MEEQTPTLCLAYTAAWMERYLWFMHPC